MRNFLNAVTSCLAIYGAYKLGENLAKHVHIVRLDRHMTDEDIEAVRNLVDKIEQTTKPVDVDPATGDESFSNFVDGLSDTMAQTMANKLVDDVATEHAPIPPTVPVAPSEPTKKPQPVKPQTKAKSKERK